MYVLVIFLLVLAWVILVLSGLSIFVRQAVDDSPYAPPVAPIADAVQTAVPREQPSIMGSQRQ
jgi:hypothetical protein